MKFRYIIASGYFLLAFSTPIHGSDEITCINPIKAYNNDATRSFFHGIYHCDKRLIDRAISNSADVHGKNENGYTAWELVKQRIKDKEYLYVEHGCRHYNSSEVSTMGLKIIQILTDAGVDTTPKISSLLQDVSDGYEFETPIADDLFKFSRQIEVQEQKYYQEKVDRFNEQYRPLPPRFRSTSTKSCPLLPRFRSSTPTKSL